MNEMFEIVRISLTLKLGEPAFYGLVKDAGIEWFSSDYVAKYPALIWNYKRAVFYVIQYPDQHFMVVMEKGGKFYSWQAGMYEINPYPALKDVWKFWKHTTIEIVREMSRRAG